MFRLGMMISIFLLSSGVCHAAYFVCQVDATVDERNHLVKRQGDCLKLGVCSGFNNTGVDENCIIATKAEYDAAGPFKKLDKGVVSGSRVVDMTQAEQDAITQAEADAELAAKQAAVDKLDVSIEDVIVALVKRINVRLSSAGLSPITKAEVVQQIKADKGID